MSLTVCKFGGSSVSCADRFRQVLRIVSQDPSRRFVVLSAPGKRSAADEKITDLFYRAHRTDNGCADSILSQIYMRYASIRDALAPDFDLEGEFDEIRAKLRLSPDYAASRGEYLCAKLFSAFASMPFADAAGLFCFDAQGGIQTAKTYEHIRSTLGGLRCAVIPGFYGCDAEGRIRTFSRGGSDVSAAMVAAALRADLYENWTDVNGLCTADPAIVPDSRTNPAAGYAQVESICRCGAKVLHPDALLHLHGTGIPVLLKNSFNPGAQGTCIRESSSDGLCCVTGLRRHPGRDLCTISIFGAAESCLRHIYNALSPIRIIHMQDHIEIIMPDAEYNNAVQAVHARLISGHA